jgi:RNA polymerase sigma factor (sigma-70 family)
VHLNQYQHITDQELIEYFKKDADNKWLGILLERYTMLLLGVSMKYLKNEEEAKDVVQQVFLKALQEIPKYEISFFKSWIYMVAKNQCLMKIRSRKGKQAVEFADYHESITDNGKKIETLEMEDLTFDLMEESMNELNADQKICIDYFYLQKKTYQETADLTGFSMMQVKSFIQNGKRNLRINIEKKMKKEISE